MLLQIHWKTLAWSGDELLVDKSMPEYGGIERRNVSQDQINRDRLLTEVHTDLKHMVSWTKDHDSQDNKRFKDITVKLDWTTKMVYMGLGGLICLQFLFHFIK